MKELLFFPVAARPAESCTIGVMPQAKPVLYVFPISHNCEKARWALDYLGISYSLRFVAPESTERSPGNWGHPVQACRTCRPVIQGSDNIIDWAEKQPNDKDRRLTPDTDREPYRQIEKRIDDIAGVHVRRYFYSEALVEHPETVWPIFTRELPVMKKILIGLARNKIRGIMIKRMDLGAEQGLESRAIIERELDWIDGLLADGRKYLAGDAFSRADIAVASLLAPLALPAEHPTYSKMTHPPRLAGDVSAWANRPSLTWVRAIYCRHR